MASLFIVEEGSKVFTKVISDNLPEAFEGSGYIAAYPVEGIKGAYLEPGKPCIGYTHILLIGSPQFVQKQPITPSLAYGAYVLSPSQFIPAESVGWMSQITKIATPCTLASAALNLASNTEVKIPSVLPWGYEYQSPLAINRTEIRQLLVPSWDETRPVILAQSEFTNLILASVSRGLPINVLFLGEAPTNLQTLLDAYSLKPEQVKYTKSNLAWKASDLYISLTNNAWPWDATLALSHRLPIAVPKVYAGETLTTELGVAIPISAFDMGPTLLAGYTPNSADIADAINRFLNEPQKMHVLANNGEKFFLKRTPKLFTQELITALFT